MGSPPLKPAGLLPTTEDQFGFNRDGRRRKREDQGRGFELLPCPNKKRRAVEEYRTFKVCLAPDDTRRFTIPLYRSWGRFEALLRAEYPWAFDLPEEGDDVVMIRYEDESRDLCILSSQSEWEALCHNRLLGPIVRLRITHEKPRFPSVKPEPMHDGDDEDSNEAEAMRATGFERDDDEDELALARSRDRAMMYSCWSSFQPPPPFLDKNINNGSQEGRGSLTVKVEARHRLGDQVKDGPCTKHNREAREASADATVGLNDVSAAAVTTTTTTSSATTPPLVMMTDSRKKRAMVQIKIERADDDSDNAMMYSNRDAEPQEAEPKEEEEDDEENDEKKEVKAEGEEEAEGMLGIFSRWTPGWMRLFRASSPLLVDPETFPPAAPEGGAEDEAQPEPEPEVERDHDQAVDRDESLLRKRRWRSSSDVRRSSSDGSRRRLRRSSSSSAAE